MIDYKTAKKDLESGIISDNINFFKDNQYNLEYGYSLILSGQLQEAEKVLRKIESLRADWAVKFIPFMKGYVEVFPTYFQIRNFLEIDINLLIKAKQSDYVSYVLGGADLFYSVNCESYKYFARVMMNNGFFDISKTYMDKARDKTYNDPELHFMYCQYFIHLRDIDNALVAINACLEILPEYYPAIKIKEALLRM
ncbi:MAG: tetratricopeptide repeat protein [Candidatus Gastranaerophilaceae bacterium]